MEQIKEMLRRAAALGSTLGNIGGSTSFIFLTIYTARRHNSIRGCLDALDNIIAGDNTNKIYD